MFKNKLNISLSILLVIIIAFAGCKSKFEKLRASNDTAKKYREAVRLYEKKDYNKALSLFDDLVTKYRGTAEAEDLSYYFAYTHYKLRDYTTARYHFKTFADTYASSAKAEECRFMAAYCFYLESPTFSLDQENTIKAIEALQLFINLYPKSERVAEASKLISNLRDKLETKSYANAKLFLDIGDYKSAVIAFRNSAREFPDTKYAEEMEFLTIKAQALYAKASFEIKQEERYNEAIQLYNEFVQNYPSSKYLKEAEEIKKSSEKAIIDVRKLIAVQTAEMKAQQEKIKAAEESKKEDTKNK
ncbi:MAG: outer membrane protein assembly factor BamD [Sphingobacteriales bacterium 17-39-43]|jgi:outer membrane protein assembly factor BamD|uniref:outer membrane protein assembly factor BamD n=1 Tax=Daejeonella sp. TaxID=2805397 RepID=UPI000BDADAB5|nr:outer membrane protein assembly factor BamD [Daejeonella sp.]MCF8453424.1 outer membrane protein assembly factor BamD [Pedobacter sp.]OYZ28742.1 MAG: outer membrane protein assembly factor BamD [Sphingobacteriales bacterium 16-39-50]OZA22146.1 MAG: outer membrane protein assembly factor BamD [Sphingobacteriales bacterium 17-39-43]HQT24772.1 outer membrane protein assembly factor BamD [Daejeonella sp.]HQT59427.1 outer membrane protein assembly factor BamD [Daejeonella sp.]